MFLVILKHFLVIPVVREKIKVKLALVIPTGAPTILVNEQIDTLPVVALKTIKIFSILLISTNRNLVWLVKFILSIVSIELLLFFFEIRQNYIIVF